MRILLLAASAFVAAGCVTQSSAGPAHDRPGVIVKNLATPGAVELRNEGSTTISLARQLIVEQLSGGKWKQVPVRLEISESCGAGSGEQCVSLAAGSVVRPLPWNGYTCAPQCPGSCRANVHLGPGQFRIVAHTCDGKHSFTGAAFTMPAAKQ